MQSADVTNEDILDNTSNVLFISHRRPTYIREWFEQRSKRRRRQHDNSALGNSEILTYRIVSYSKKLTQKDVQTAIVKALRKWAKVIPMLLRLGSQKTDLNIHFVRFLLFCSPFFFVLFISLFFIYIMFTSASP